MIALIKGLHICLNENRFSLCGSLLLLIVLVQARHKFTFQASSGVSAFATKDSKVAIMVDTVEK